MGGFGSRAGHFPAEWASALQLKGSEQSANVSHSDWQPLLIKAISQPGCPTGLAL